MTERPPSPSLLISEFARRCRLPISTLRYYDRIGLLIPASVDPTSGYRRYTADQLRAAVLIARLRAIGTAPGDIAEALAGGERAAAVYLAERVRLTRRIADSRRALTDLDDLVRYLGDPRAHRVELVRLAGEQVAAAPFHTAHAEATSTVLRTIARLRHSLRGRAHTLGGPWGATFPLRPTERVSGFVFARTTRPLDRSEPDTAGLPSTRAARTTHHGGPATLDAAYLAVFDAIERRGWEPADPVIEEYLTLDNGPTRAPAIRLTVPIAPGWPYSRPAAAGPPCRGSEAAADQPG